MPPKSLVRKLGDQGPHFFGVHGAGLDPVFGSVDRHGSDEVHLLFPHGNLEPALVDELGRIAKLLVKSHPGLSGAGGHGDGKGLVGAGAHATAVARRGFLAYKPLLKDNNVNARVGEKIGGAEPGYPAPDNRNLGAVQLHLAAPIRGFQLDSGPLEPLWPVGAGLFGLVGIPHRPEGEGKGRECGRLLSAHLKGRLPRLGRRSGRPPRGSVGLGSSPYRPS